MVRTRKAIYVGDQEVKRRYIGNKLIFENLGERNMVKAEESLYGGTATAIYFDPKMVVGKTYVLSFDFEFPEHVTNPPRQFRIFALQGVIGTNTNLTSLGIFSLPSGRNGSVHAYFNLISEYMGDGDPLRMIIHHGTYGSEYVEATLSNLKLEEGSA